LLEKLTALKSAHDLGASMKGTHKKLVLRPLQSILGVEESKTNKQTTRNIENDLRHEVCRVTPVGKEVALRKDNSLVNP
jgi:hypothetical protein